MELISPKERCPAIDKYGESEQVLLCYKRTSGKLEYQLAFYLKKSGKPQGDWVDGAYNSYNEPDFWAELPKIK